MKCLSIKQPWASLIMAGLKQHETRGWKTDYRGILMIHASKSFEYEFQVLCEKEPYKSALREAGFPSRIDLPRQVLIGTVELVEVIPTNLLNVEALGAREQEFGDFRPGRYAWKLRNPRPLDKPVTMTGRLNLFEIPDSLVYVDNRVMSPAAS